MVGGNISTHFSLGQSAVTQLAPYTANTWYKVTMVVNAASNAFDFYIDDVLRGSGSVRTAITTLDVFNITAGGTGTGFDDFWVDYIKVYQGEPVFPVDIDE
jgi:hypothetical protein